MLSKAEMIDFWYLTRLISYIDTDVSEGPMTLNSWLK
jgi:hypothetical protein